MTTAALHWTRHHDPHAVAAPPAAIRLADSDAVRGLLQAGLHWLHDTAQPDDAVIDAHGAAAATSDNRLIRFVPLGWGWRASIVIEVAHVSWGAGPGGGPPLNPLHPHDIDTVAAQLGALGAAVTATRCASAGLAANITLARSAHPSLRSAVTRFAAGCPTHHSRICGHPHRHGGHHNCPWYSNGQRGVRWPFDPWPGRTGSS